MLHCRELLSLAFVMSATPALANLPVNPSVPTEIAAEFDAQLAADERTAQAHLDAAELDARQSVEVASIDEFAPSFTSERSGRCRVLGGGRASYYNKGKVTANGERFNKSGLTAAHRTLPFGAMVRVTNHKNNRSVMVRINDRGPFIGGRVIDLTEGAARSIGMGGLASVTLESCL